MATSAKKMEQLDRARARIESTTPDKLAVSFDNGGYRDALDWWNTEVQTYPELFKGDDAIVRPAWVAAAPASRKAAPAFVAATDKQLSFARKLQAERDQDADLSAMSKQDVSKYIDALLRLPKVARKPVAPAELEDGMYLKGDEIFKVQHAIHGSGRQYAKQLRVVLEPERDDEGDIIQPGKIVFDYVIGAIYKLTADDRMTLEQAEQFGALYGTCVRCGRTLTKEKSIERAMGPVCAGKL